MNPAVAVLGYIRFSPDKVAQVLPHLKAVVEATRQHDGCIAYDVAEDPFDPGLIRFSELWPDQATLDRHLQAPHIEPWRSAVRALGLLERNFTAYEVTGSRKI